MISIAVCVATLVSAFFAARRSLVWGLTTVLTVGYLYGIYRANVVEMASHFTFDAAVAGFYGGLWARGLSPEERRRAAPLKSWVVLLAGWPALLFLLPLQDPMVQLVGLRASVYLLPFLLVGALLSDDDRYELATVLGWLNVAVFVVAVAEFVIGVPAFFPANEVTKIIYSSQDVAGFTAFRIPGTFTSAHAYGGAMVLSLPLLIGAWVQPSQSRARRLFLLVAIALSIVAVFMSAARSHALLLVLALFVASISLTIRPSLLFSWVVVLAMSTVVILSDVRFQRFTSLADTENVTTRVASSINTDFVQAMLDYPIGNGLGGGGTSLPYFLEDRLDRNGVPILESEYARVLLEQGIPGLFLLVMFLVWVFVGTIGQGSKTDRWLVGRRIARALSAGLFATGLIGLGLFTSIPGTVFLLLFVGWISSPAEAPDAVAAEGPEPLAAPERRPAASRSVGY